MNSRLREVKIVTLKDEEDVVFESCNEIAEDLYKQLLKEDSGGVIITLEVSYDDEKLSD